MSTYSLQLLNFPENYEQGSFPNGPRAYIALQTWSEVKWCDKSGTKEDDFPVITPECVSIEEFRNQVKRLVKELETIDKQAEKFFAKDMDSKRPKSGPKT